MVGSNSKSGVISGPPLFPRHGPAVFQHGRSGRACLPATAFLTHLVDTMTF